MMNILDQIISVKRREVELGKSIQPAKQLEGSIYFDRAVISVVERLHRSDSTGIIAEFKKASPSKGIINDKVTVEEVVSAYADAGAAAISVLTDESFFKGSLSDLQTARSITNDVPLLRKDFVIDEYQILQARSAGADIILLIAACLTKQEVKQLASFAHSLNLEVLLEIHSEEELDHIVEEVDLVGVNNRDLKTFTVSIEQSKRISNKIPLEKIKISESGIYNMQTIDELREYGYKGFLIGENFMREKDPGDAFRKFVGTKAN